MYIGGVLNATDTVLDRPIFSHVFQYSRAVLYTSNIEEVYYIHRRCIIYNRHSIGSSDIAWITQGVTYALPARPNTGRSPPPL